MGCNNSQEERDPPQQEMRSVVVFDPEAREIDRVQIPADGMSIQNHPSLEVDSTWDGKIIYVYCNDPNPTSATPIQYRLSDHKLGPEDSPSYPLGPIKIEKHWYGQGTERKLYIGRIPDPAALVPQPRN